MQPTTPTPTPGVVPALPTSFTLDDLALILAVVLIASLSYLLARWCLTTFAGRLITRARPQLAAALEQQRFYGAIALLAPAVIFVIADPLLRPRLSWAHAIFAQMLSCYIIVVVMLALHRLLNALDAISSQSDASGATTLHTVFRWVQIGNFAVAVILTLSVFTSIPVTWVLSAIGVILATGSIVFSDMLYNMVSRLILKGRHLVAEGDWVQVPALEIDGEVTAIEPQLIVVQNWDHSLATVPPRYLLTNTFRNWQQMYRVGVRRMQRYLYLDVTSMHVMDGNQPSAEGKAASGAVSPYSQTNVALYRAYLMSYLESHPKVSKHHPWRVTNEDAVGFGLPLVLLAHLTETGDVPFRLLDAEIYEHALAVAPRFGLRVFQAPTGADYSVQRGSIAV